MHLTSPRWHLIRPGIGVVLVAVCSVLGVGSAGGQARPPALEAGARVRITGDEIPERRISGVLISADSQTLRILRADTTDISVARERVELLERSGGRDSRAGLRRGMWAGIALSVALEAAAIVKDSNESRDGVGPSLVFPIVGAPIVILVTSLVGGTLFAPERWEVVDPPGRVERRSSRTPGSSRHGHPPLRGTCRRGAARDRRKQCRTEAGGAEGGPETSCPPCRGLASVADPPSYLLRRIAAAPMGAASGRRGAPRCRG